MINTYYVVMSVLLYTINFQSIIHRLSVGNIKIFVIWNLCVRVQFLKILIVNKNVKTHVKDIFGKAIQIVLQNLLLNKKYYNLWTLVSEETHIFTNNAKMYHIHNMWINLQERNEVSNEI